MAVTRLSARVLKVTTSREVVRFWGVTGRRRER
jgi:hypothetical protein